MLLLFTMSASGLCLQIFQLQLFPWAATVVSINTGYCAAILPKRSMSLVVAVVLTAVYGVLYTILEAEDYALLGGTVLLVVALVVTMFFTRRLHRQAADEPGVKLNP